MQALHSQSGLQCPRHVSDDYPSALSGNFAMAQTATATPHRHHGESIVAKQLPISGVCFF